MREGTRFTIAVVAVTALFAQAVVACGHRDNGQGAIARAPSADVPGPDGGMPSDGGLPLPPPASRKGLIVPSDMGLGAGPAGPTTNSGTPPATPQPIVPAGM